MTPRSPVDIALFTTLALVVGATCYNHRSA